MSVSYEFGSIADVLLADSEVPELGGRTTQQIIESRLKGKRHLIVVAKVNGKPVGYKIGYELSNDEFYIWLGGVSPEYRQQGIATELRKQQEEFALKSGYSLISVKSMNRYPEMLQLLISSGYHICGYEDNGTIESSKIKFIRSLSISV